MLSLCYQVVRNAIGHFLEDDGAAIASHVALNILMSLFPFMIFLTALAGFFGTPELAQSVEELMFDAWPDEVAGPITAEVDAVLLQPRGDLLTISGLIAIVLASNGVEALRVALNRAYRVTETRSFIITRLQSLGFVLLGSIGLLSLAFVIVLGPVLWRTAFSYFPLLSDFEGHFILLRLTGGIGTLLVGLVLVHLWLPAGSRPFLSLLPGIAFTLALWLVAGFGFAAYLENFSAYTATYAGLASVMIAIVFLYLVAVVFILGAELNAALSVCLKGEPDPS